MRQWAASYSANRDAIGLPSWRSSFLGDAGANFFCTGHDVLEMLPPPQSALRPKRVTLWATQGFAPTGVAGANHHEVGPNEKIKRGQIKLTESTSTIPRLRSKGARIENSVGFDGAARASRSELGFCNCSRAQHRSVVTQKMPDTVKTAPGRGNAGSLHHFLCSHPKHDSRGQCQQPGGRPA